MVGIGSSSFSLHIHFMGGGEGPKLGHKKYLQIPPFSNSLHLSVILCPIMCLVKHIIGSSQHT